jgi:hypothetical protein
MPVMQAQPQRKSECPQIPNPAARTANRPLQLLPKEVSVSLRRLETVVRLLLTPLQVKGQILVMPCKSPGPKRDIKLWQNLVINLAKSLLKITTRIQGLTQELTPERTQIRIAKLQSTKSVPRP